MADESQKVEIAVLKEKNKNLEQRVEKLIEAVERNNEFLTRTKGIAFGAAIIISAVWGLILAAWKYLGTQ
ncbi:hypothetical protein [Aliikangiella coralliicola]|uniref:Uncharacterized protein n=1 Tax=Aliikangiella coralliicola TaxID=2592383 RepID=A0A545U053_9GAMM|nr:hypothetical protein [Aliikangiella coralliicola]TQV82845.1 hypothetical protein FLL46_24050 [Aliikangiella coralliicola]